MGLFKNIVALIAVATLALTGGTLHVDLAKEVPTVTICSAHGSYVMSLEIGEGQDEAAVELCCGACVAVDAPDPLAARAWAPPLIGTSRDVVVAIAAFVGTAPLWREPPSRAPPFIV